MSLWFARRLIPGVILSLSPGALVLSAADSSPVVLGGHVRIAAASSLVFALEAIDAEFVRSNPGVNLTYTSGASGNLLAQINNGAPFDVLISADLEFAKRLIKGGHASAASLRVFATGELVLWTMSPGLDISSIERVVRDPAVHKIAIANPETAPYGLAARQTLVHLGLWDAAEPKLVRGDNISQAAEFVETGNADVGFVALSLIISTKTRERGRWTEVPTILHAPLIQAAVLTTNGGSNLAAQAFLDFLCGSRAGGILKEYGYNLPH